MTTPSAVLARPVWFRGRAPVAVLTAVLVAAGVLPLALLDDAEARQQPGTAGGSTAAAVATKVPAVLLTFETPEQEPGSVVDWVRNTGSVPVSIASVRTDGGVLRSVTYHGQALGTPDFQRTVDEPRAVLQVRGSRSSDGDELDPGRSAFAFGATFRLDAVSDGTSVDNGDNLVQRGLALDVSQYKLEVDHRRPACRVKGSAGTVRVVSSVVAEAGSWYRARCRRHPGRVVLVVTDSSSGHKTRTTGWGSTGSLRPESPRVPLSVGGKLQADGALESATDQFNGSIDDVVLRIS